MGAIVDLSHAPRVIHWHFFQMSVANVVVIVVTLVLFLGAIVLPAPSARRRRLFVSAVEPSPSRSSWLYVFGVAALAALIVVVGSGAILALKGPDWWHYAAVGHFFNSIHLWAVELFFLFTVVHLWGKYWTAAWRGGRARVWVAGAIAFLIAVPAAFTGYLSQQNFDAQWLAVEANDAINSTGVGVFFSAADFGQAYSYHVLLLPAAMAAVVVAHILLVRRHGLVPPYEQRESAAADRRRSRARLAA